MSVDMLKDCVFCAIASGEAEADRVWEEPNLVAFLDRAPLFPGHVLVVPRAHHETLLDLPADALGPFFATVQRLARAIEVGLGAEGTFVAMNNRISQSVPHLHVHVVPRRKRDGLKGFFWPRHKYASSEEREEVVAKIRGAML